MTHPATQTVRDAAYALFRQFGLTTVFGNPGSTELPMFRDFPADFRYVLGLQESVVLAMADGYAQATGRAALVNLHSAVGVGHAMGAIFTAFKNHTPLVITAGQQARSILPYEPFLFSADAPQLPKPYVKWSIEPARAADVPHALARAYYVAMQAPRGPTLVSVPVDDWDQSSLLLPGREVSQRTCGDPALLRRAAVLLDAAQRPVLVVGAAVARDDAWHETIALAERLEAPVWVSPHSARNSFPADHRLFAGFLPADRPQIVHRLAGADLVLVLGAPAFTYHVEASGPHVPEGAQLIQLTDDPAAAAWAPIGLGIVTHLKEGVATLLAQTPARPRATATVPARSAPVTAGPLTEGLLLSRLAALRSRHSIIVEEAPGSRPAMHQFLPILEPNTFHTCASGGLGHGLPAAVGIALARPDAKVIALLGDGSAMYAIQALWTAAHYALPIAFVIVNNRGYEALNHFGRVFGLREVQGTEIQGLDFVALAKGHGVAAMRVDSVALLDDALRAALSAKGPLLLDIHVTADGA
jgi:benzoylformate decarboxylase